MKHYVCVTIGINQYQFLQPLSYAQRDAEALNQFWAEDAGFASDRCVLITDTSPETWDMPTYPSRGNLLDWMESICREQLQAEDTLFCFFSGYGIHHKGQDYLIPIDGSPENLEETAIPISLLFKYLNNAPTDNILLLLDINRTQGVQVGDQIGGETIALSEKFRIPTILSCRPDEVSRETSSLRHGFFTAALLEGLKSGKCQTLADLKSFLGDRLPELTDQHLRPLQNPVFAIATAEQAQLRLKPEPAKAMAAAGNHQSNSAVNSTFAPKQNGSHPSALPNLKLSSPFKTAPVSQPDPSENPTEPLNHDPASESSPEAADPSQKTNEQPQEEIMSDRSFFQQLIIWSGAIAVLLLLGVFYTNRSLFVGSQPSTTPSLPPMELSQPPTPETTDPTETEALTPPEAVVGDDVPETPAPTPANGEQLLQQARMIVQNTSASRLSQAIVQANQIPNNDPLYPEAQLAIERWSQMILDIAEGRAAMGNWSEAIAAASLVPETKRPIYEQAQLQIQNWQQPLTQLRENQAKIEAARSQIRPGQASTYSNAIAAVSTIGPEELGYDQATEAIARWSGEIWKLAQSRAQNNQFESAISAAVLIPEGTPPYTAAQQAIAQWRARTPNRNQTQN